MFNFYKIGEISNLLKLPHSTLRHYDKIGFIKPGFKHEKSRYRYYSQEQLFQLTMAKFLKSRGLSLKEIQHYFTLDNPENVISLYYQKLLSIQKEIAKKENILDSLKVFQKKIQCFMDLQKASNLSKPFIKNLPQQLYFIAPLKSFTNLEFFKTHNSILDKLEKLKIRMLDIYQIFFPRTYREKKMLMGIPIDRPSQTKIQKNPDCLLEIPASDYLATLHQGSFKASLTTYKTLEEFLLEKAWLPNPDIPITQEHYRPVSLAEKSHDFLFEIRIPLSARQ